MTASRPKSGEYWYGDPIGPKLTLLRVRTLLKEWNDGSDMMRHTMLMDFITLFKGKKGIDLEKEMADCGILLLIRITAWYRIIYATHADLVVIFESLRIFFSSLASHSYMSEFATMGGIQCLLETIAGNHCHVNDKCMALALLLKLSWAGKKFIRAVCKYNGIRIIGEYMGRTHCDKSIDMARSVLAVLSSDVRQQTQVMKAFTQLMLAKHHRCQHLSTDSLRTMNKEGMKMNNAVIRSAFTLFSSLHTTVREEAASLVLDVLRQGNAGLQAEILHNIITILKKPEEESLKNGLDSFVLSTEYTEYTESEKLVSEAGNEEKSPAEAAIKKVLFHKSPAQVSDSARTSSISEKLDANFSETQLRKSPESSIESDSDYEEDTDTAKVEQKPAEECKESEGSVSVKEDESKASVDASDKTDFNYSCSTDHEKPSVHESNASADDTVCEKPSESITYNESKVSSDVTYDDKLASRDCRVSFDDAIDQEKHASESGKTLESKGSFDESMRSISDLLKKIETEETDSEDIENIKTDDRKERIASLVSDIVEEEDWADVIDYISQITPNFHFKPESTSAGSLTQESEEPLPCCVEQWAVIDLIAQIAESLPNTMEKLFKLDVMKLLSIRGEDSTTAKEGLSTYHLIMQHLIEKYPESTADWKKYLDEITAQKDSYSNK